MNQGVTLLELLIVMAILAILGSAGFSFYYGFRVTVELEEEQNSIAKILREAKANAIASEQGYAWGVIFSATTTPNRYAIFTGTNYATSNTTTHYFLPSTIEFETPSSGSSLSIIFTKRTGTTTAATTTIRLISETSKKKDVAVSAEGLILK